MKDTDRYKLSMACGFGHEKTPHAPCYNLAEEMIGNDNERNGPTTMREGI